MPRDDADMRQHQCRGCTCIVTLTPLKAEAQDAKHLADTKGVPKGLSKDAVAAASKSAASAEKTVAETAEALQALDHGAHWDIHASLGEPVTGGETPPLRAEVGV